MADKQRSDKAKQPKDTKSVTRTQDSVGIAEALGNFAERAAKKPHNHWYFGYDENNQVAMFPEELGLPLHQATQATVETIKTAIAKELEPIIAMRSQGIWYDLTDKKADKMNETTLTGCSVVPTRELIKLWEKLTSQEWVIDLVELRRIDHDKHANPQSKATLKKGSE